MANPTYLQPKLKEENDLEGFIIKDIEHLTDK